MHLINLPLRKKIYTSINNIIIKREETYCSRARQWRCLLSEDGIDKSIKIKLSRWGLDLLFPFLLSFLDINYIILIVTFIIVNILKFKRTYCIISCIEI